MKNFIDLEASGLGYGSYPIEVGVALADGSRRCTLIRPLPEWTQWDESAETLHGISRECLLINGRSVMKVALMLNEWLQGQTVYTDAWGNDSCWLARLFAEAGVTQRFKLDSVVSLLDTRQKEQWHETKSQVIKSLEIQRHRASNDALVLQQTYARLAQESSDDTEQYPGPELSAAL